MAFGWREGVDGFGDGVPDVVHGSCGGFFEEGLELREWHLDGIEVGAIVRQEAQFGAGGFDGVERAKDDWRENRFPKVAGDEEEFIPFPE